MLLLLFVVLVSSASLADRLCLRSNPDICLGVSGYVPDPDKDPIVPMALQVKRSSTAAHKIEWSGIGNITTLCLTYSAGALCAARGYTDVEVAQDPGPEQWTLTPTKIKWTADPTLCMTLAVCERKPSPDFSTTNTYCDSRVTALNKMSATQIAAAGDELRGSYVKLAKCSLNYESQRFVWVNPTSSPSASPTAEPSSSSSPTHSPTLSSTLVPSSSSPSISPSFVPTSSPSSVPTPDPTARPTSRVTPDAVVTPSPTGAPSSSASSSLWWVGLLVGLVLIAAGVGVSGYYYWKSHPSM